MSFEHTKKYSGWYRVREADHYAKWSTDLVGPFETAEEALLYCFPRTTAVYVGVSKEVRLVPSVEEVTE